MPGSPMGTNRRENVEDGNIGVMKGHEIPGKRGGLLPLSDPILSPWKGFVDNCLIS